MIPELVLSSESRPAVFAGGRAFPVQKHIDYELGPIAIQDPSRGSQHQIWRARMENQFVYLSAPNVAEFVLLDLPKVTEISFTFDQNARHIFAYVQDGVSWLRWYDSSVSQYVTTPINGITPRVTLDDKRDLQRAISDVLVFYARDNSLFMRMQRDRYGVEYHLATNVTDGIVKCGMMRNLRVGVQLAQYQPAVLV
ncbi:MAG TPA: hypothetical protein PLZ58_04075 [Candidatus Saccharibacteria bacterium]|nr:hypothetical protein [Candidatus Saccharibacteria bacterium]